MIGQVYVQALLDCLIKAGVFLAIEAAAHIAEQVVNQQHGAALAKQLRRIQPVVKIVDRGIAVSADQYIKGIFGVKKLVQGFEMVLPAKFDDFAGRIG